MNTPPDRRLPYGRQTIDEADISAVDGVLRSPLITQGPLVEAFEAGVAARAGVEHGVAVSSGTAALHSACLASGLKEGQEAIVPVLTFAATAAAVRLTGAEVRFADIDPDTWGVTNETLAPALSDLTRAVLPVDFAGQPCAWDGITALARDHALTTISDAAHALGGLFNERPVGSLADMTCFSFHPVKAITTAEGGMTVTNDDVLADALRRVRGHGIERMPDRLVQTTEASGATGGDLTPDPAPWYYEVQDIGLNYRISDLQCALGLSQLDKLDAFLARRQALAARYQEAFKGQELLQAPVIAEGRTSAWHLYVIRLNLKALAWSRRQVFEDLRARGVGVQVHYIPLHLHPYYRARYGHQRGDFPNAESYYDEALSLPLFPAMTDGDADFVVATVLEVLGKAKR